MLYKMIFSLALSISITNSYAQIEKEPVNEMTESSFSGYYDIPKDKISTVITNIKEKDKFLFHTTNEEDEIEILTQEQANKYFFQKYIIKKTSPIIVLKEPKTPKSFYNDDLEIKTVEGKTVLIKEFYNTFGKIPKIYNLFLAGKDNQYYPIDMSSFEKDRQTNFYTDYDGVDYNLGLVPDAKNIYITTSAKIYPFRSNLNYYIDNLKNISLIKLYLEETKPRAQTYNNFYINFNNPNFVIEITNIDLKKDILYFLNTPLNNLKWDINEKTMQLNIKKGEKITHTVTLKNYIKNDRNIKMCESDKCTNRFINLEEFLSSK